MTRAPLYLLAVLGCTTETSPLPGPEVPPDTDPVDASGDDAASTTTLVDAAPPPVDAAAPPPDGEPCAAPGFETWTGTAQRDNDSGYPDHIAADVTWERTATDGCVDTYAPSGVATYGYAIPGALCMQSITPASHDVAAGDGELRVDRTTAPATYVGRGATTWTVTFRCQYDDGTFDEHTFEGGATWFDASGTVEGATITGQETYPDDTARCGPEGIPPCTYRWSFTGA